jgi:hypothetical protein
LKHRRTKWQPDSYQVTVDDWLRTAAFAETDDRTLDDIHFNHLIGPWAKAHNGAELATFAGDVLRDVVAAVPNHPNLHGVRDAIVALPIRLSQKIRLWKPRYWAKAGMGHEPPSLILTKTDQFQRRFDEEYCRELEPPTGGSRDVRVVYKSYRERSADAHDVGNAIFLFISLRSP